LHHALGGEEEEKINVYAEKEKCQPSRYGLWCKKGTSGGFFSCLGSKMGKNIKKKRRLPEEKEKRDLTRK